VWRHRTLQSRREATRREQDASPGEGSFRPPTALYAATRLRALCEASAQPKAHGGALVDCLLRRSARHASRRAGARPHGPHDGRADSRSCLVERGHRVARSPAGRSSVDGTLGGGGHTRLIAERLVMKGSFWARPRPAGHCGRRADLAGLPSRSRGPIFANCRPAR